MAFLKYARAHTVLPHVNLNSGTWDKVRVASQDGRLGSNLIDQASEIFGKQFDPNDYLLSHVTIVASVGVETVPNVKLGSFQEGRKRLTRKYPDFRVKMGCDPWINNNDDCWSHAVLGKSYRTFIGGYNFVEHVQVEELSKGRIIDAVLRHPDGIDSFYTDILVATDRQHADLIRQIESGEMGTLSMGCSVVETLCTKCGNVAQDETDMCSHIRFAKGNYFYDTQGNKHRIAELCGHESLEPNGGVEFIEGSWVKIPAFKGAVLRNIIAPREIRDMLASGPYEVLNRPPAEWGGEASQKVASQVLSFGFGDDDDEEGGDKAPDNPFEELEGEVERKVLDKVRKKIMDRIKGPEPTPISPEDSTAEPNNNLVKQSSLDRRAVEYQAGIRALVRTASSNADLLNRVAAYNREMGIQVPVKVYRAALEVGPSNQYKSLKSFLKRCQHVFGQAPTRSEAKTLIRLGHLLSLQAANGRTRGNSKE